jgi:hypothetical protein
MATTTKRIKTTQVKTCKARPAMSIELACSYSIKVVRSLKKEDVV